MIKKIVYGTAAALIAGFAVSVSASDTLYKLEQSATLPSTDTYWDYIKMEPAGNRLFMARVKDGLTVFDVDANKAIKTVEKSIGANGPLLLPEYNRGYVAMTDGSLLSFDLKTLEPINRLPLASDGGLNSAIYDPATHKIYAITGTRKEKATWFILDAATGELLEEKVFPFRKMDDPATDGRGILFAPVRYDDIILKLDSTADFREVARWEMPCHVSKVQYQKATNRLFAACLGDEPIFMALDADTGREIARVPIGKGLDALVVDEAHNRIITSNGTVGSLTVIEQEGADEYSLLGTVATRPGARMMHIDNRTGNLYVVFAEYTEPAGMGDHDDPVYHPDSFTVLTYSPQ
ncbi:YncE family protein [Kordiimonas pumila]|uniref:YncE family protein n=1 Tax=Kordiimonas pumila TaxID=2161677 RepID=A0ABV7D0Z4_9PROT|nr:hypothetical protein [Kordiimonas pumila]